MAVAVGKTWVECAVGRKGHAVDVAGETGADVNGRPIGCTSRARPFHSVFRRIACRFTLGSALPCCAPLQARPSLAARLQPGREVAWLTSGYGRALNAKPRAGRLKRWAMRPDRGCQHPCLCVQQPFGSFLVSEVSRGGVTGGQQVRWPAKGLRDQQANRRSDKTSTPSNTGASKFADTVNRPAAGPSDGGTLQGAMQGHCGRADARPWTRPVQFARLNGHGLWSCLKDALTRLQPTRPVAWATRCHIAGCRPFVEAEPGLVLAPVLAPGDQIKLLPEQWMVRMRHPKRSALNVTMWRN